MILLKALCYDRYVCTTPNSLFKYQHSHDRKHLRIIIKIEGIPWPNISGGWSPLYWEYRPAETEKSPLTIYGYDKSISMLLANPPPWLVALLTCHCTLVQSSPPLDIHHPNNSSSRKSCSSRRWPRIGWAHGALCLFYLININRHMHVSICWMLAGYGHFSARV